MNECYCAAPEEKIPDALTLFDMASVTKVMSTMVLALVALERGLGFVLVLVDFKYPQAYPLFDGGLGHCGHTGESVFLNPKTGLSVILLSDATRMSNLKYGSEHYGDMIRMRTELHEAVRKDIF